MYKAVLLNKLNNLFPDDYEIVDGASPCDAILVRSQSLHSLHFSDDLLTIGRAGAGVNNIPIDKCTEKGIVVFNTPGANANAVKELVIASLLLASRDIYGGLKWVEGYKGENVEKDVEAAKSNFAGIEISGKTLTVIGLGQIGVMVANAAIALGMQVVAYDPYLSTDAALRLNPAVKLEKHLNKALAAGDFVTIHVPLNDKTKGMIGEKEFKHLKAGARLLNFSRAELVSIPSLIASIDSGAVSLYVTDFPTALLKRSGIIAIPHLGASTEEAEQNCAVAVTKQVDDFLRKGIIRNSVNFPEIDAAPSTQHRLVIMNRNQPGMVGKISAVLSEAKINIAEMINKSKGDYAVTIIDSDTALSEEIITQMALLEGVIKVRYLKIT